MRGSSRIAFCSVITITGSGLLGCGKVQQALSEKPAVAVVALFDTSASTDQQALKDRYTREFLTIIDSTANTGLLLRGDVIHATPLAETTFPLRIDIPKPSINKNDFTQEELVRNAKQKAADGLRQLFAAGPATANTQLLDAIEVTSRLFNGAELRDIQDRRLVIFSDMIESSERYEFSRGTLRPAAIRMMLEREEKAGRVPSLKSVHVWVAGAGAGGGQKLSGDQLRGIEQFWLQYFRKAGADLPETQYGSSLLNFSAAQ